MMFYPKENFSLQNTDFLKNGHPRAVVNCFKNHSHTLFYLPIGKCFSRVTRKCLCRYHLCSSSGRWRQSPKVMSSQWARDRGYISTSRAVTSQLCSCHSLANISCKWLLENEAQQKTLTYSGTQRIHIQCSKCCWCCLWLFPILSQSSTASRGIMNS